MAVKIGISGWRYGGWRGVFYPKDLPQRRELEFASRAVDTIEINGSHYSLQSINSYLSWYGATPDGFTFSVKGPRYLTHMLRFRDETARPAIANFFASGVLALRDKLGAFLWQFPPTFKFAPESFEAFLALLPRDAESAAALAREHDGRVKEPWCEVDVNRRLRHAIEIRHPSFCVPEFVALLRKHKAALVVSDATADWPYVEDVTSDFVYLRLHGSETLYGGAYTDEALDRFAARVDAWSHGGEPGDAVRIARRAPTRRRSRDVLVYFDNDKKVEAPFDAARLRQRVVPSTATTDAKQSGHAD
ncbi:DUF72 domain-containing protein [Paraburkholderia phymatum]|uniref:DUF72 domain-containing protein n=1 Tax=Paraburkholderia phymatum (strain DSM 17167 / CIP 108236 / LMG 21445 / STM815) TaxID=391038 RepID=B2JR95_PARP8|nr:DUF72 domain-containing protein [Paraburkholderia phymatum]ACC73761.1 protein of unknown function DUF72 [Paraburkholderia phymatum STM815]